MCDEQIGQVEFGLQLLEQAENLCLHRDIQGRHRFICNHKIGIEGQCAGDRDALPLAAAEGMGIAPHVCRVKADATQELGDPFLQFATAADQPSGDERLADYLQDGEARVQR